MRNAEQKAGRLFRIPRSDFRVHVMIVLVLDQPQDLVNIAHVVRAMKNFGFSDLRLVRPREYDAYRVAGIAHQTQDVLARVREFDDLGAALADCVHIVGFTARERSAKRNRQRPRTAAGEILEQAGAGPVALLFGREDKGLSNEALDRCHRIVTIPTAPAYASLNLGHAVALILYELALARGDEERPFKAPRRAAGPAAAAELERLFADVERALERIEFFKTRDREAIMRAVREVVHRTPLDQREAKLLRAMAIEIGKYGERLARSGLHIHRQ
jgi:tRNA/rRNA methyltransferase/tRNA (cytidine32/uridine32-2'-O)-methyltransferase